MNTVILKSLYDVRNADDCFLYTSKKEHTALLEAGYVEVDPECHNGMNGFMRKIATHITEAGVSFIEKEFGIVEEKTHIDSVESDTNEIEKKNPKEKSKMTFEIKRGGIPAVTRKAGVRESKYPFAELPAPEGDDYAYFTVEGADAVKKIQSAMNNANHKFSEPTGEMYESKRTEGKMLEERKPIRKFICRAVKNEAGEVVSANVYRVI